MAYPTKCRATIKGFEGFFLVELFVAKLFDKTKMDKLYWTKKNLENVLSAHNSGGDW